MPAADPASRGRRNAREGGISCRHDRINHPTMPSSRSYMKKIDIEKGSKRADARFRITVEETGPYLVYGQPPLAQQFIMPDAEGESWYFQQGAHFPTDDEPTALCRCGASKNKPYCDGAHVHAAWDPRLTADDAPLLDNVELTEGETLSMTDNPKYCVFARFSATPRGGVESGRATGERRGARTGHPRGFDVPQRPADGVGQRDRHSLRIPLRAVAGTHRRRRHRSQQRPNGCAAEFPSAANRARPTRSATASCCAAAARRTTSPTATGTPRSGSTTGSEGTPEGETLPEKVS